MKSNPSVLSPPVTTKPLESYLIRVQRDPQAQLGHAVLLQQLEVRAQRHAESSRHVLRQPAVVGRVAQAVGLVFTLKEEHLREARNRQLKQRADDLTKCPDFLLRRNWVTTLFFCKLQDTEAIWRSFTSCWGL